MVERPSWIIEMPPKGILEWKEPKLLKRCARTGSLLENGRRSRTTFFKHVKEDVFLNLERGTHQ
jgi:hypothetical protein